MATWTIDGTKNDGYPYLTALGEPSDLDLTTLLVDPKPLLAWRIDGTKNDGYPYVVFEIQDWVAYRMLTPLWTEQSAVYKYTGSTWARCNIYRRTFK